MENPETSLYIAGLPNGATEATLAVHFGRYGAVLGTKVIRNRSGTPRGFVSVTFSDAYSVHLALRDLSSHRILGHKVHVKIWKQPPNRSQEPMMSQQPPSESTRRYDGYRSSGTTSMGGMGSIQNENNLTMLQLGNYYEKFGFLESNNRRDTGDRQPGRITSRSDYIDSPAPTNNGVRPPRFGGSTSGIGGDSGWIQQGEHAGFPSSIPQISPSGIDDTFDNITPNFPQPGGSSSCFDCPAPTNNGVPHPYSRRFNSEIGVNGDLILQGRYAGAGFPSSILRNVPSQESMGSRYDVVRNSFQVPTAPIGTRPNVPLVSIAPIGTRPNAPPGLMAPIGTRPYVPPVSIAPIGTCPNAPPGLMAPIGTRPYVPPVSLAPIGTRPNVPYAPANMSRDGGRGRATGSQTMHNRVTAQAMDQRGFMSENALADLNSSMDEYETPDFDGTAGQRFSRFHGQP